MSSEFLYNQRIVVIGGGTGTFTLLRGLTKLNQPELNTAIPGMWDNGGSTGRLRSELGTLPVGDVRQCLFGLMDDEEQQRITLILSNDRLKNRLGPLHGHNFFNLELDLLSTILGGLQNGIDGFRAIHKIKGYVYPVTLTDIDLGAQFTSGPDLLGEDKLDERWKEADFDPNNKVEAVYLSADVKANPLAVEAIGSADIIVFPPGSFYGSIATHFLVGGIKEAIISSRAKLVKVCNLMTERGQTDTLDKASDYVKEFIRYLGDPNRLDYLVINQNGIEGEPLQFYMQKGHQKPVEVDFEECRKVSPKLIFAGRSMTTYIQSQHLLRHDPLKLAEVVLDPEKFVLAD